jgi:hypothetical protein
MELRVGSPRHASQMHGGNQVPTTSAYRDVIASHSDDPDKLLKALEEAGWEVIASEDYEDLLTIRAAAFAVAGAELNGSGQEGAWGDFEEALAGIYGTDWLSVVAMNVYGIRGI